MTRASVDRVNKEQTGTDWGMKMSISQDGNSTISSTSSTLLIPPPLFSPTVLTPTRSLHPHGLYLLTVTTLPLPTTPPSSPVRIHHSKIIKAPPRLDIKMRSTLLILLPFLATALAAPYPPGRLGLRSLTARQLDGQPCVEDSDCLATAFCNEFGHGISACLSYRDCRGPGLACPSGQEWV